MSDNYAALAMDTTRKKLFSRQLYFNQKASLICKTARQNKEAAGNKIEPEQTSFLRPQNPSFSFNMRLKNNYRTAKC
jgi:hypothetical protein